MTFQALSKAVLGCAGMLLLAATAAAQAVPPVLNTSDPALRLWLDAATLADAGLVEGDPVTSWVDRSSYGTIMAPRTTSNPSGPFIGDPVEENPHLQFVEIAGKMAPSVRFDRDGPTSQLGDPNVDGTGSTDRLYQTNNLAPEFDPLDIGDGSNLTTFIVFNPDVTTSLGSTGGPILGYQVIYGKRGTNSSVYQLGIKNYPNEGFFTHVSYDGPVEYQSMVAPTEQVWHVTSQVITDNEGSAEVDTLQFFDADAMSPDQTLTELGTQRVNAQGTPNNLINNRNASTPEPFGLGGHSQACCGEGETFAGNIAELIIFAKKLSDQEFADVSSYLSQKYFATGGGGLDGDYDGDSDVDGDDLVVWENQFGILPVPAAPNADGNGNGAVDGGDFLVWQNNFGAPGAAGAASAIPEPTAAVLLASGLAMMARVHVRKRTRLAAGAAAPHCEGA
ncbi:MAG: hypothetical protein IT424_00915 [Pirellulales bacterium]|nr:hypothetical protein [Pirellulales bacterium]